MVIKPVIPIPVGMPVMRAMDNIPRLIMVHNATWIVTFGPVLKRLSPMVAAVHHNPASGLIPLNNHGIETTNPYVLSRSPALAHLVQYAAS
jgi:hypothetical protein